LKKWKKMNLCENEIHITEAWSLQTKWENFQNMQRISKDSDVMRKGLSFSVKRLIFQLPELMMTPKKVFYTPQISASDLAVGLNQDSSPGNPDSV
jgi:hypothetical protein